jgi:hypothetical protein
LANPIIFRTARNGSCSPESRAIRSEAVDYYEGEE